MLKIDMFNTDRLRCPLFLHPARRATVPGFAGEAKSKYEIWWTFGWPFETSAAMQRLVFSQLFDPLPTIKILAHHLGAMVPYFEGRVGYGLDQFGARTADEDYESLRRSLPKRPTTSRCSGRIRRSSGSAAATEYGLKFFGLRSCSRRMRRAGRSNCHRFSIVASA
jgi:uncharacterized protein